MITTNCHTHTCRCKHAQGDVREYCVEAVRQGLETLGFSDHAPLPDGRWHSVRMEMAELEGYCRAVDAARLEFPALTVLKGLECEYVPEFVGVYQDLFLGAHAMDYLVAGAHWYPHRGEWTALYGTPMSGPMLRDYVDYVIASMQSGLFAFVAHPDLFGVAYASWDAEAEACSRALLTAAGDLDMPMEINGYGLRKPMVDGPDGWRYKYPWRPFWELAAECGVSAVLSSDAHEPEHVGVGLRETAALAESCGVEVVLNPVARTAAAMAR